MAALITTLQVQLACQLIHSGQYSYENFTLVPNKSAPNNSPKVLPEGYTAFPDIGVAYKFYKNQLPWNSARKLCLVDGATLAIVDSFKKIEYIMGMKPKEEGVHTGIHRMFDDIEWTSIKDGQPLGFIPWKPDANINAGTGNCVAMWFDGKGVGPWNCSIALPIVCEVPLFGENGHSESNPSLNLASKISAN